jgi:hypothetical protein
MGLRENDGINEILDGKVGASGVTRDYNMTEELQKLKNEL